MITKAKVKMKKTLVKNLKVTWNRKVSMEKKMEMIEYRRYKTMKFRKNLKKKGSGSSISIIYEDNKENERIIDKKLSATSIMDR